MSFWVFLVLFKLIMRPSLAHLDLQNSKNDIHILYPRPYDIFSKRVSRNVQKLKITLESTSSVNIFNYQLINGDDSED